MTTDLTLAAPPDSAAPAFAGVPSSPVPGMPGRLRLPTVASDSTPPAASRRPSAHAAHAASGRARDRSADLTGRLLIAATCVLLAALAAAMGVTSFHAQFTYVFAAKRQWVPSVLEAAGLDAGAVIFSLLGIAVARSGRRAVTERALVVACALGSCGMNALNADLGSPRSVAVYAMPPVLFALASDRLTAVVRTVALGQAGEPGDQRSAWAAAGRGLLYVLRFTVDAAGTSRGVRQAILNAAPLPQPPRPVGHAWAADGTGGCVSSGGSAPGEPPPSAPDTRNGQSGEHRRPRFRPDGVSRPGTKTARFLTLVRDKYGPLDQLPLNDVYRVSAELAPAVSLHDGSARAALRIAVLSARDGAP